MAAAVTVPQNGIDYPGMTHKRIRGFIAFDSSYPTGGEAITMPKAEYVLELRVGGSAGYVFEADLSSQSAPKVKAMMGDNNNAADGPGVEGANTTDLSALTAVPFSALVG